MEELAEHMDQWSYSIAFFKLLFIPLARLHSFCKSTKVDRLRREIKELLRQVEASCEFTNSRRAKIEFLPNHPASALFLKAEKESGDSPLSKFISYLRQRSKQRNDSLVDSSVLVGAESSVFRKKLPELDEEDNEQDPEEGAAVFSSSWLPEKKKKVIKEKTSKKRAWGDGDDDDADEDVVEDLVLSSEEDDDIDFDEGEHSVKQDKKLVTSSSDPKVSKEKSATASKKQRKPCKKKAKKAVKT